MTPSPLTVLSHQSARTGSTQPRVSLFSKSSMDKATESLDLTHKCGQEKEVVLPLLSVLSRQLVKDIALLERWGLAGL